MKLFNIDKWVLLLVLFLCSTNGFVFAQQSSDDHAVQYQVQPGDRLVVTVYREDDLTGTYQVDPQGDMVYPLIGRVHAAGRTIGDVRQEIYDKLLADYLVNPEVSISRDNKGATEPSLQSVFVLGHVKTPGSYNFETGQTLMKAIARAGGFAPTANIKKITIARSVNGSKSMLTVNADDVIAGKSDDVQLQPGDIINVPRSVF